jgi:hypothetical protein
MTKEGKPFTDSSSAKSSPSSGSKSSTSLAVSYCWYSWMRSVIFAFGLYKFELLHSFREVPMGKSATLKHRGEVHKNSLEDRLNGNGICQQETGGLQPPLRSNVADGRIDVVRNPLDEIRRILIFHDGSHATFYLLGRNPFPRKMAEAVKYFSFLGIQILTIVLRASYCKKGDFSKCFVIDSYHLGNQIVYGGCRKSSGSYRTERSISGDEEMKGKGKERGSRQAFSNPR